MTRRRGKRKGRPSTPPRPTAVALGGRPLPTAVPLLVAVVGLAVTFTLSFFWNEDFWWYLASGEEILEERSIPEDDFLYPAENRGLWIQHSWLWTVLVATVYRLAGLPGEIALSAGLAAALLGLVFTHARLDRFGVINALVSMALLAVLNHRLSLKAELATWILSLIYIRAFERDEAWGPRRIASIAGLQWLWSNLHGGYPLGVAIAAAYALPSGIRGLRRRADSTAAPLWLPLLLLAVSFATPGLSGERLRVLGRLLGTDGAPVAGLPETAILEWGATLAGPSDLYSLSYLLFVALGAAALLLVRSPRRFSRSLLLAGLAALAASAVRFVPGLVMIAGVVLLAQLADAAGGTRWARAAVPRALHLGAAVLLGLLLALSAVGVRLSRAALEVGQSRDRLTSLSPLSTAPGAAAWLLATAPDGPLFNDMFLGGYLVHRLYPGQRLFIDSRNLSEALLARYSELLRSPHAWAAAERRFGFRTAIVTTLPTRGAIRSILSGRPGWHLVYYDPLSAIFVQDGGGVLAEGHPRGLPDGGSGVPFLPACRNAACRALRGLARPLVRYDAEGFLVDTLSAYGELGRHDAVTDLATEVLAARPGWPEVRWLRGMARMSLGQSAAAVEDLGAAIDSGLDSVEARITFARLLLRLGRREEALRQVLAAERLAPSDRRLRELRRRLAPPGAP